MCNRKRQRQFLRDLLRSSKAHRQLKIEHCRDADVRFLSECALNLLQGNIPITSKQKQTLSRHKKLLRKLAAPKRTSKYRKKLFGQAGQGFWFALLPAAISALTSLFK